MKTTTWVYCVVEATGVSLPAELAGPPGCGPPRALPVDGGLWLVVSSAPLPGFAAETIDARLQDLDFVGACAMGHEKVVEAAGKLGAVVPMKLFTMFRSDSRAVEQVRQDRARVGQVLERVRGRDEWGLRVRVAAPLREEAPRTRPGTGAEFLRGRKEQHDRKRERARTAREGALAADEALAKLAVRSLRLPASRADGLASAPLIESAYLVDRTRAAAFQRAAEAQAQLLARAGCSAELTGPWPAYSFLEDPDG